VLLIVYSVLMQGLQVCGHASWLSERLKHAACADEEEFRRESLVVRASCRGDCGLPLGCCVAMWRAAPGTLLDMLSARRSRSWACPPPQVFTGGNADFAGWPACPCRRTCSHRRWNGTAILYGETGGNGGIRVVVQLVMEGCMQRKQRWWASQ